MKLAFIEVAGFRGFRNRIKVNLAAGFTIISGPNGVGKSSLLDAVEYLLLGKFTKYSDEKAAGETVDDYVWTVGDPVPPSRFVTLGFTDSRNGSFEVTRTPESGLSISAQDLEKMFCFDCEGPEAALELLCRTSIIRDELISGMSLDLAERERFQFVSTAIGSIGAADDVERAKGIIASAEAIENAAEREYMEVRGQLSGAISQLSKAEEAAARSSDVSSALDRFQNLTGAQKTEAVDSTAFRAVAVKKSEVLARLEKWRDHWSASLSKLAVGHPNSIPELLTAAKTRVEQLTAERNTATQRLADAKQVLTKVRETDELAAAVSDIVQLGRSVGRLDGHCPLCDTKLGEEGFQRGMRAAATRVKKSEAATSAATGVDTANAHLGAMELQLSEAEEIARALELGETTLSVAAREIREAFDRAGFEIGADVTADRMTSAIGKASTELAELERALRVLELAQTTSGAKELEEKIAALKVQSDDLERRQARARKAVQRAKDIQKAITRTRNELLEERLASISPLLTELYRRFSPHFDWRTIEYKLRGDVRRLLSLSVGESFNPQFMFSSGQRRIAGLAFLLSVYLSRTWSTWQTLLLDDPMQHIDDYRALSLTEVLSAIRRDGRQIVCAVENEERSGLLARRLRSSPESPGATVKLDLDAAGSLSILSWEPVEPFPIETITSVGREVG